jgi:hypothetical protein
MIWGSAAGATHRARLHNLLQREVHPGIAGDQVSVQRLAILELHEHRVPLGGGQEAQWKLEGVSMKEFARTEGEN